MHDHLSDDELLVTIDATTPLRRAGFERALERAGLAAATEGTLTSISVRTSDDPPTTAPIDISVSTDQIDLIIRTTLQPAVWVALGRLIEELMTATEPDTSP